MTDYSPAFLNVSNSARPFRSVILFRVTTEAVSLIIRQASIHALHRKPRSLLQRVHKLLRETSKLTIFLTVHFKLKPSRLQRGCLHLCSRQRASGKIYFVRSELAAGHAVSSLCTRSSGELWHRWLKENAMLSWNYSWSLRIQHWYKLTTQQCLFFFFKGQICL